MGGVDVVVDTTQVSHSVGLSVLEGGLILVLGSLGAGETVGAAMVAHHERGVVIGEVEAVVLSRLAVTCYTIKIIDNHGGFSIRKKMTIRHV